jgi:hypothetical protein
LDILQSKDDIRFDDLVTPIVDFIKEASLTTIAIPINECPKCKEIPKAAINGLLPIDFQELLFSLVTTKLITHSKA